MPKSSKAPAQEPMRLRIEPCKPVLKQTPPEGSNWSYEIKLEGYRVAVHVDPDKVSILTGGHDWTPGFIRIATTALALG